MLAHACMHEYIYLYVCMYMCVWKRKLFANIHGIACGTIDKVYLQHQIVLQFSVNSGWYSIWECTNQKDCNVLESATSYSTCNVTTYHWLSWNKTSLSLHSWTNVDFWGIPAVSHTWTTDLNITHIIKPSGSEYFQGYFGQWLFFCIRVRCCYWFKTTQTVPSSAWNRLTD